MDKILNLDQMAARCAQNIVHQGKGEKLENQVTKSLGVLQEQGIYAVLLFLFSQDVKEARAIYQNLIALLKEIGLKDKGGTPIYVQDQGNFDKKENYFQYVLKIYSDHILENIDHLFLVRDLYEQTLIYARYGAKAWDKANKNTESKISSSGSDGNA